MSIPTDSPASAEVEERVAADSVDIEGEKTSIDSSSLDKAPEGGLRAWLVVAGSFCIFFSALGFTNAFGVFQQYYLTHQLRDEPVDNIAWIGSISSFAQFATGVISGPIFDRYGAWIVRPAAVLYVFAIMMTSLGTAYYELVLAQGVLMGIVMGFLQIPAMAAVSQHFDKKRAAALGVVISGSSIGGIVIPIALAKMLNETSLGFGWSVRVIGLLITPLMIFACFTVRARVPSRTTSFFIGAAFKDKTYMLLIASLFANLLGMMTPLFFLPIYATTQGLEPALASYLVAIINASSTFGRIIPGVLADKFGRQNMFAFAGFSTGIVVLCMTLTKSTAGFIVYSIVIGFTSGTIISAGSAALTICPKDPRDLGTYMGMGMAIGSLAVLIGPPINGALVERYASFLQLSIFSGVMCLVGGCIALLSKFFSAKN